MDRERANSWLTLLANLGVLGGLVFVGLEIRQNTSQLRADASYSITESVNQMNEGMYGDAALTELVLRGEQNLDALDAIDRTRFEYYQFSRLNLAEYILDLEAEGVADLNFRYVDYIVSDFRSKPGLQEFITSVGDSYAGSAELYSRLRRP
jgi:hypothetical protein